MMEIKSKIEKKIINKELLVVYIDPINQSVIVDILTSLLKKGKPDRFEEYVVNGLIKAIEKPEQSSIELQQENSDKQAEILQEVPVKVEEQVSEYTRQDKIRIVSEIKSRLDPKNEKSFDKFIEESVQFGQRQFGIKTVPKSSSVESFYDWLCENRIVNLDGSPVSNR